MRTTFAAPLVVALMIATLLALAGCDAPYVKPYVDQFRDQYGWNEERTLASGWIPPRDITPDPAYCYRTLATPDCYTEAEPKREKPRLIGSTGPSPE
jgi:hypothetical protein